MSEHALVPFRAGLLLALALAAAPSTWAQDDRAAERAARRQQLQLQQLQQQVTQAQAEKTQAEQAKAAADKAIAGKTRAAARASAAEKAAAEQLRAMQAEKDTLQQRIAELEQAAVAQGRAHELALAAKDTELAQAALNLRQQTGARDEWQQRFGQQARLVTECSEKNERLVRLGAELLQRWQGKGVMDALRQREPVLGLGDVQMFNLVQAYRDKTDNERFVPKASHE